MCSDQSDRWRNAGDAFLRAYEVEGVGICESAIEKMLAIELREPAAKWGYEVIPQYKLGRFRYDFAIKSKKTDKVLALVECDGRDWHWTPEQRANDAKKDALAKKRGLILFRFNGYQLNANAAECAECVIFALWPR